MSSVLFDDTIIEVPSLSRLPALNPLERAQLDLSVLAYAYHLHPSLDEKLQLILIKLHNATLNSI